MDVRATGEEPTVGQTAAHGAQSGTSRAGKCPDVTVIIPVYNAEGYLERCIGSVLNQTLGTQHVQCIAVDDGSTDGSGEVLDRLAGDNRCLEVFHQPNSGGPAAPRNFALQHARGRYVFFLDQDDYLAEDALEAMVRMADQNGTDIVLARMKSLGGRTTPLTMFAKTVGVTDVFSSSAYWVLNPLKLFRLSLIRKLDLRFQEDVRVYEDQPFVSKAYLGCNGISILSDKDYIFWVFRDDASNISTSRISLSELLPGATRLFDLVAERVPEGPKRDRLMRRHFENELLGLTFRGYRMEEDSVARHDAFKVFQRLAAAYYTERLDRSFVPRGRVLMRLVERGDERMFGDYLEALNAAPAPAVLVEGDHLFVQLPHFRDAMWDLPDELFDIAGQLNVAGRFERLSRKSDCIGVRGACRFGAFTESVDGVSLVLRTRDGVESLEIPLAFDVCHDEGTPYVDIDADVPSYALASTEKGVPQRLWVRLCSDGTCREKELIECAPPPSLRIISGSGPAGGRTHAVLSANAKGELTLSSTTASGVVRRLAGRAKRLIARRARKLLRRA